MPELQRLVAMVRRLHLVLLPRPRLRWVVALRRQRWRLVALLRLGSGTCCRPGMASRGVKLCRLSWPLVRRVLVQTVISE